MPEKEGPEITLTTLHEDLRGGFADLKGELRELRVTLVAGFRNMPSRETSEEMVRLLREGNRLQEERFTQLDTRIREQHLEIQQVLRVMAEGIGTLAGEVRTLSSDIKALIARIDALIRGREDGNPTT